MSETFATYQHDSIPVAELPKRYGIGRTAFYARVEALGLQFEKKGNKSFATADQIDQLDALNDHIKAGNTIESFVESLPEQSVEQTEQEGGGLVIQNDPALAPIELFERMARIMQPQAQPDPLAHIRLLDEACEKHWKLGTSELCALLKRSHISGDEISKYGFVCRKVGKQGRESAWTVERE